MLTPDGIADYSPTVANLVHRWREAGGRIELNYSTTVTHVEVRDWRAIFACLDDGSGALLSTAPLLPFPVPPQAPPWADLAQAASKKRTASRDPARPPPFRTLRSSRALLPAL